MDTINITYPQNNFNFDNITLSQPTVITSGNYMTKILNSESPLYIQLPKCTTKQGFVKTNKKINCDILLENLNEELIGWFENLDNKCKEILIKKSEDWFSTSLEKEDMDTLFTPTLKLYKSGKFSSIKTNIKVNSLGEPQITIYDETQNPVAIDSISSETYLIFILEIIGIRFSSRNFALDLEIKQAMTVTPKDETIFNKCIIQPITPISFQPHIQPLLEQNNTDQEIQQKSTITPTYNTAKLDTAIILPTEKKEELVVCLDTFNEINDTLETLQEKNEIVDKITNIETLEPVMTLKKPEFNNNQDITFELEDILVDNSTECLELKKPENIYYDLYKNAKQKMREAILEFNRIKKEYNIYSSDEDTDTDTDPERDLDHEIIYDSD